MLINCKNHKELVKVQAHFLWTWRQHCMRTWYDVYMVLTLASCSIVAVLSFNVLSCCVNLPMSADVIFVWNDKEQIMRSKFNIYICTKVKYDSTRINFAFFPLPNMTYEHLYFYHTITTKTTFGKDQRMPATGYISYLTLSTSLKHYCGSECVFYVDAHVSPCLFPITRWHAHVFSVQQRRVWTSCFACFCAYFQHAL